MSRKLFKVKVRMLPRIISTNVDYSECYVLSNNPTEAYNKYRKFLDREKIGSFYDKSMDNISLIAEEEKYPNCNKILICNEIYDKDIFKKELIKLIKEIAYKEGEFTLASGKKSNYYIDLRKVTLHPYGNFLISSLIYNEIIKPWKAEQIAGLELGAVPIVCGLMSYSYFNDISNMNFGIARKKIKEHGTKNLIEGNIDKNKSIILVEDVITTGNSILEVAKNLTMNGYNIFAIVAVVDRTENDEIDLKYEFNFYSLIEIKEIREV